VGVGKAQVYDDQTRVSGSLANRSRRAEPADEMFGNVKHPSQVENGRSTPRFFNSTAVTLEASTPGAGVHDQFTQGDFYLFRSKACVI
jgi:hypothetical protein